MKVSKQLWLQFLLWWWSSSHPERLTSVHNNTERVTQICSTFTFHWHLTYHLSSFICRAFLFLSANSNWKLSSVFKDKKMFYSTHHFFAIRFFLDHLFCFDVDYFCSIVHPVRQSCWVDIVIFESLRCFIVRLGRQEMWRINRNWREIKMWGN